MNRVENHQQGMCLVSTSPTYYLSLLIDPQHRKFVTLYLDT